MTSDEQKPSENRSPKGRGWKGKLRKFFQTQSSIVELREKIEAAITAGTISELDDANVAIKRITDSLDLVELIIAAEEFGMEGALEGPKNVRDLLWLLRKLEIEEKRQREG